MRALSGRRWGIPVVLMATGLVFTAYYLLAQGEWSQSAVAPTAEVKAVAESGSPTPAAVSANTPLPTATATETPGSTATAVPPVTETATPHLAQEPASAPFPENVVTRIGVSGSMSHVAPALASGLRFGHYLNWNFHARPERPQDVVFWHTVRVEAGGPRRAWDDLAQAVAAQPGSIWIVGNEPDVPVQDNVAADRYAEIYHEVYTFIKERDAGALVAIAGVAQPTPLRLAYLDRVLDAYEQRYGAPLPVDVWTIHGFIVREEQDSWGAGIPAGLDGHSGALYAIRDHDDLTIFADNLIAFRAWMAARGYQERPLALTEFGILMPEDYGFPPEAVAAFLEGALDFLLTATNETGYPADEYRLVQWSFWYSLYDPGDYPTGNLLDPSLGQLTALGRALAVYLEQFDR
jgi:hypothetical protein